MRFGYGLSPSIAPPLGLADMLSRLSGPDLMSQKYPIENYDQFTARIGEFIAARGERKKAKGTAGEKAAQKAMRRIVRRSRRQATLSLGASLLRRARTADAFRERLEFFWADHFSVVAKGQRMAGVVPSYSESAIRPFVGATFSELLKSAVLHPAMLNFLDQNASVGPNSALAAREDGKGLNENLAREILELHTLGVDGPYSQTDVRQLAELLTGLGTNRDGAMVFRHRRAEPGAETVLGRSYSGEFAEIEDIHAVLDDLSAHPATARHIAGKLARHFVSNNPDPDLVAAIEAKFLETGGALLPTYEAMLTHPAAWDQAGGKIKQPITFVASAFRALDASDRDLGGVDRNQLVQMVDAPLARMGQAWGRPLGPDGWPDHDSHWITPQGLAARLQWALMAPSMLRRGLVDPRQLVGQALGPRATETLHFAASAAETRREGVALVLTSPAFQRH
nr:DUF1800 domain-containing protein [Shimia biformata]